MRIPGSLTVLVAHSLYELSNPYACVDSEDLANIKQKYDGIRIEIHASIITGDFGSGHHRSRRHLALEGLDAYAAPDGGQELPEVLHTHTEGEIANGA